MRETAGVSTHTVPGALLQHHLSLLKIKYKLNKIRNYEEKNKNKNKTARLTQLIHKIFTEKV